MTLLPPLANFRTFTPLITNAQDKAKRYLPSLSSKAITILESTATIQIILTTCKTLSYVTTPNELNINNFYLFLRTRIHYLELSLLCTAGLVHTANLGILNLIFFVICGGLNLGFNRESDQNISYSLQKYCQQTLHYIAGIAIGLLGVMTPSLGILLTELFLRYLKDGLVDDCKRDFENLEYPLLAEIKRLLIKNWQQITEAISTHLKSSYGKDEHHYSTYIDPLLNRFMDQLEEVKHFYELAALVKTTWKEYTNHL